MLKQKLRQGAGMKRFLVLVFLVGFSAASFAKGKAMIQRGGASFLFPDHNLFLENPGQFSTSQGVGIQGLYAQQTVGPVTGKAVEASVAAATGRFGIGAAVSRSGTTLDQDANDVAGVGMGFNFGKERFTMGASYQRSIDTAQQGSGVARAAFTYNSPKGIGPSIGVGAGRTLDTGADVTSAIAAIGFMFKDGMSNLSGQVYFPDIDDTSLYTGSLFLTVATSHFYLASGYSYEKSSVDSTHLAQGRLGVVLWDRFDISAIVIHRFVTGVDPVYGGSLRVTL